MNSLVIFVSVLNFQFAMALKHTSALIKQVQAVPSGSSPEKSIECAFKLMKAIHVAAKIPGGTDSCKLLYFSQLTGFEPGNEYLEKTTKFDYFTSPATFKETVQHILFSEVKVGDKFQFVIQKSNTDKFGIVFNDATKTTMLSFQDRSNQVIMKDVYNGTIGEMKIAQSYPFSDFKEYKVVFQVLELHWQIIIDDVAFTTFTHRYPFTQIRKIKVMVGHAVTYLTKAFDPRLPE